LVVLSLATGASSSVSAAGQDVGPDRLTPNQDSLEEAARLYFNAMYQAAADMALRLRANAPEDLATFELRSSALHLQLKREVAAAGHPRDRKRALRECAGCAALVEGVKADVNEGRRLAHDRLKADSRDRDALFFLGKVDLTHVWLHNDTLGQRTGWNEYREARRVLEDVLEQDAGHIRARVARAFIDYVVDTRVPWAFRWALGGGNRKRALATLRETRTIPATPAVHAEARFALWEMLMRDGQTDEAVQVARELSQEFPENRELRRFLAENGA